MLQIAQVVPRNHKDKTQLMLAALMSSNSLDRLSHGSFHCADSGWLWADLNAADS